jgi:hypothetical protein
MDAGDGLALASQRSSNALEAPVTAERRRSARHEQTVFDGEEDDGGEGDPRVASAESTGRSNATPASKPIADRHRHERCRSVDEMKRIRRTGPAHEKAERDEPVDREESDETQDAAINGKAMIEVPGRAAGRERRPERDDEQDERDDHRRVTEELMRP